MKKEKLIRIFKNCKKKNCDIDVYFKGKEKNAERLKIMSVNNDGFVTGHQSYNNTEYEVSFYTTNVERIVLPVKGINQTRESTYCSSPISSSQDSQQMVDLTIDAFQKLGPGWENKYFAAMRNFKADFQKGHRGCTLQVNWGLPATPLMREVMKPETVVVDNTEITHWVPKKSDC